MSKEKQQKAILAVLLAGLAFVVIRQFGPGLFSGSSPGGRAVSGSQRVSSELGGLEVVELRLADLERQTAEYSPGRDPFRFGVEERPPAPPPPPPAAPSQEERTRQALESALAARRQQASAAPPKPQPPPVDLVYLGSFGPRSDRLAVFSDGTQIYNAFEGEVLKKQFIVVQIGFESADLGFVGFPDAPPQRLAAGE